MRGSPEAKNWCSPCVMTCRIASTASAAPVAPESIHANAAARRRSTRASLCTRFRRRSDDRYEVPELFRLRPVRSEAEVDDQRDPQLRRALHDLAHDGLDPIAF